MGKRFKK